MFCAVSVAACFVHCLCVCCAQCVWDGGSGLCMAPARARSCGGPKGEQLQPQRGHRWGQRHVGDRASDSLWGRHGGIWGYPRGYEACGRLGNPVGVMGHPGKQCDTQRVRILGRGLGAHPGDQGPLDGRVVVVTGHPWELWDTQERGEGTGEVRDTLGGYGTPRRLGKPTDL